MLIAKRDWLEREKSFAGVFYWLDLRLETLRGGWIMAIARKKHVFNVFVAHLVNLCLRPLVRRKRSDCCSPSIPILGSIVVSAGAEEQRCNYGNQGQCGFHFVFFRCRSLQLDLEI